MICRDLLWIDPSLPGNLLRPDRSLTLPAQNGLAARSGEFIFSHVLTLRARQGAPKRGGLVAQPSQLDTALPDQQLFKRGHSRGQVRILGGDVPDSIRCHPGRALLSQ